MSQRSILVEDESELEFPHLPPFPTDIPIAPLLRVKLSKLLSRDQTEIDRLFKASRELGFFYLDVRGEKAGEELVGYARELFGEGKKIFDLPVKEKNKFDLGSRGLHYGYKGYGGSILDGNGTKDRNEFYNASKDDLFGISDPLPAPDSAHACRPLLRKFMTGCHGVSVLLLNHLNESLGLPTGALASLHRLEAASGDQVRWINAPAQPAGDRGVAFGQHTDFGSVTVLFNQLGGLQVLLPDTKTWAWVKPLRGHAVINLGDTLVKLSAGTLTSNVHRVVNPPGAQSHLDRLSLMYFCRPEDTVVLKVLEGSKIIDEQKAKSPTYQGEETATAKDWILTRAMARRTGTDLKASIGTETIILGKRMSKL